MFRRFPRPAILQYVKSWGAGRVLVGVLTALLLGGPVLGVLAAADPGGVPSTVTDVILQSHSDDDDGGDDDGDGLDPLAHTPDSPDSLDSPDSPDSP